MYLITINGGMHMLFKRFPTRLGIANAVMDRSKTDSPNWRQNYIQLSAQIMLTPNWDFIHREMEAGVYTHQQSSILKVEKIEAED